MGAVVFHIAFVATGALMGAAAGWFLRGGGTIFTPITPRQTTARPASATSQKKKSSDVADQQFSAAEAILARLHQLTESVSADLGEHSTRVQAINDELNASEDEAAVVAAVEKLIKVNEDMQAQLQASDERLQAQAEEIESHVQEARTDPLTKLANRRAFDDEIARCVGEYKRSGSPSCVMVIDIDHFKQFNDTYGHQVGDEVLCCVARTLRRSFTGKETVCRYGGEEFAVIFPDCEIDSALPTAEKARAAIGKEVFESDGLDLKVTASGGLSQLLPAEDGKELVKRADDALYMSKEEGRDCGYWHDGIDFHPMQVPNLDAETIADLAKEAYQSTGETPESESEQAERVGGLSDRASFLADVERRVSEWKRGGANLSVLLVEIDQFKSIAEQHGDDARVDVQCAAALFLKASIRDMDHISLYGDGIFALLMPGAGVAEADAASERIRATAAQQSLPIHGQEVTVTFSLGGAEIAPDEDGESLLERAQDSLDAARGDGGDCSYFAAQDGERRQLAVASDS